MSGISGASARCTLAVLSTGPHVPTACKQQCSNAGC